MEILILNGSYFYKLALEALPMKSNVQQLQIWIIERDDSFTVYLRPLRFDTLFFFIIYPYILYMKQQARLLVNLTTLRGRGQQIKSQRLI